MPKSQYKSNYELKILARTQMGSHMGILIGAMLLNFIISYAVIDVISSLVPGDSTLSYVINYVVIFIAQVLISVLDLGVIYIYMKSACYMNSTIKDLFFGYRHHFVRALKIGLILVIIKSICTIPVDIATVQFSDIMENNVFFNNYTTGGLGSLILGDTATDTAEMLESYNVFTNSAMRYYVIILVCSFISFLMTLPFFPAYYMLLDFPNQSVTQILKKCFEVMHGNKFRLVLMYLSFIPLMLLCMFTCGIALLWVLPYMKMTAANFYLDMMSVRNKTKVHINKTV